MVAGTGFEPVKIAMLEAWCDSQTPLTDAFEMVPRVRLELTRLYGTADFESAKSTSSIISG